MDKRKGLGSDWKKKDDDWFFFWCVVVMFIVLSPIAIIPIMVMEAEKHRPICTIDASVTNKRQHDDIGLFLGDMYIPPGGYYLVLHANGETRNVEVPKAVYDAVVDRRPTAIKYYCPPRPERLLPPRIIH